MGSVFTLHARHAVGPKVLPVVLESAPRIAHGVGVFAQNHGPTDRGGKGLEEV